MLSGPEIITLRRSASMAPLPNDTVREVLDTCDHLFKERQQIAVILAELPESFGAVRTALNDLQRILGHNPA